MFKKGIKKSQTKNSPKTEKKEEEENIIEIHNVLSPDAQYMAPSNQHNN